MVDDGSTDETLELAVGLASALREAEQTRLRVLTQAHAGPSAARNLGAASAQGDVLAFLDADDAWLPHTFPTAAGGAGPGFGRGTRTDRVPCRRSSSALGGALPGLPGRRRTHPS